MTLRHLAIIPDGNRRWAARHGQPPEEGHRRGFLETSPRLIEAAWVSGIHTVTLWLFSTDNWRRSREEVALQGDAIAVAAGHLENGLDAVAHQEVRRGETRHMGLRSRPVGYVDRRSEAAQGERTLDEFSRVGGNRRG